MKREGLSQGLKFFSGQAGTTDEGAEGSPGHFPMIWNGEGGDIARFGENDVAALLARLVPTVSFENPHNFLPR